MDAQGEIEALIFCETIGVLQPNGLSPNHIKSGRAPNLHSNPSTVVFEHNFSECDPPILCKFHRQWIGTGNNTFHRWYNSIWFEIVNACHAHGPNMTINRYDSLLRFLSSHRELGLRCDNVIDDIIATKDSIDSLLVALKNRRRGCIPRRVIAANKIHF